MRKAKKNLRPIVHQEERWECPICGEEFYDKETCAEGLKFLPADPFPVETKVKSRFGAFRGKVIRSDVINKARANGHVHARQIVVRTKIAGDVRLYITEGRDDSQQLVKA